LRLARGPHVILMRDPLRCAMYASGLLHPP